MPEEEAGGESLIHVAISAEEVFQIGPLVVTNSMIGALLASAILLLATWYISRRGSALIPGRLQGVIELPIELLAGIISASTSRWRSYAALILCFFLMILVANWIGLLPGVGTVGINHVEEGHEVLVPIVRPASADLNFTLGLAIISVVMFIYWGIRAHGVGGYLRELMGEPLYLAPLIFPINVISELSRLISLSMRLFGNVFAGEVLLATMLALTTFAAFVYPLALFIPGLFVGLEILFGFVQALVFALLSLTYISTAIAEHHEPGDASDHGETDTAHSSHPPAAEAATT